MLNGGEKVQSKWVTPRQIEAILEALTPQNRLACKVSLITGLRINDCLNLKTEQIQKGRFTVREQKTGKTRRITLPKGLQEEVLRSAGTIYAFENRLNGRRPRTRQAVFKDLKRASVLFRVGKNVSPHSLRKIYAVSEFGKDHNLKRVQKLLNHSDEAVTMIYALADQVAKRRNYEIPKS